MTDFKAIILAGGSGERFWPLSTPERPKQFLNVFGNESLIRQSVTRLKGLVKPKDVYVITAQALVAATRKELPEIPKENIIGEPMRRDTGAAVALGVGIASIRVGKGQKGPFVHNVSKGPNDPVLGFFPADQIAANPAGFRKAVSAAITRAKKTDAIVTIGIKPAFPATGFGYVNPKAGTFVEKPNEAKAKTYLKKGFLWNAGMFIGRAEIFKAAFAAHAPALLPLVSVGGAAGIRALPKTYEPLPRISFDYAVMEHLKNVEVVKGDFGWDDVGSYAAFDKHFKRGKDGNIVLGDVNAVESDGCTAVAKGAKIALLGVKDLVVVTTKDAVLVVSKKKVAELKKLFAK